MPDQPYEYVSVSKPVLKLALDETGQSYYFPGAPPVQVHRELSALVGR